MRSPHLDVTPGCLLGISLPLDAFGLKPEVGRGCGSLALDAMTA